MGNSSLTHAFTHTTHAVPSLVPLCSLLPFLSTLFRSFLPDKFPFPKHVSFPAAAQQWPASFQLSKIRNHWSQWTARHMLKPLDGGWQWLATLKNNHLTMYIIKQRDEIGWNQLSACMCTCICVEMRLNAFQPVDC